MKIAAIIPARYASSRLPGKPLMEISGKPMILHVVDRALSVSLISRVVVATDDQRIFDVVTIAGFKAMMTREDHQTGTDRLAEVAAQLDDELIVNIQGDEPFIDPGTIQAAIEPMLENPSLMMSTTCEPIESAADLQNPNVVKVVTDPEGNALYFSRSPIPFPRAAVLESGSLDAAIKENPGLLSSFAKHTGMYVYRRDFLLKFASLPASPLEKLEALEQLRALENGYRIRVVKTSHRSIGVDTPEDLEKVRNLSL